MKKDKMRITHIMTICTFLLVIFSLTIINIFAPKESFSENENRVLSPFPSLSLSNIFGGSFDDQFESWFTDHFVSRDTWIQTKAMTKIIVGSNENNSVYIGKDGHLIGSFIDSDSKAIQTNTDSINAFAEDIGKNVNVLLVPGAAYGDSQYLPSGSYNLDQEQMIQDIYALMPKQNNIDICDKLKGQDAYFKTDHHWNEIGAYAAYQSICSSVLNTQPQTFTYTKVSDDFKGTMYSKAGTFWMQGDSLYRIDSSQANDVTVTFEDGSIMNSLYNDENLNGKDKYTYYLDGNHAFEKITTSVDNGKKAIIIKDSYAHILVPYLAQEYSEIDMIDLRYYKDSVSKLIEDINQTDIYVLYSVDEFTSSKNLAALW